MNKIVCNSSGGLAALAFALIVAANAPAVTFVLPDGTLISEMDATYDGDDIVVSNATVTIDGAHNFNSLLLTNNAVLTHSPSTTNLTHKLDITVTGDIVVSSDSRIDVSGRGYLAQRTSGNTTNGASGGQSGGSFGGRGGERNATSNPVYADYRNADDWGSGGGGTLAGPGGGRVRLSAHTLHLDGQLLADGLQGGNINVVGYGGGSGGGIYVSVGLLTGNGSIRAGGGRGGIASISSGSGGGGGGGGRVAVYAADFFGFSAINLTAPGGLGGSAKSSGPPGGPGTVYLRDTDETLGVLIIDRAGGGSGVTPLGLPDQDTMMFDDAVVVGANAVVVPEHEGMFFEFSGTLTVSNSATVRLENAVLNGVAPLALEPNSLLQVSGALTSAVPMTVSSGVLEVDQLVAPALSLTNGALLTAQVSTTNSMHKLEVNVTGTITVSSNSAIDVTGKGYLAQRTSGNTTDGAATGNSGGSYGGLGGDRNGVANAVYGDYTDPDDWGSGGRVGAGGGLVRLSAQRLELDGRLWANGAGGSLGSFVSGGGSGGGVYVAVEELVGNGSIQANGGPAVFLSGSGWTGGAGGGGRIAIYAGDFSGFPQANATASGNGGSYPGGTGTVYWRDTDETVGTLIVTGSGFGTGLTPLGLPGQDSVMFNDRVLVRAGANVIAEHAGMSFEFAQTLTISNDNTQVELEDVTLSGTPPLELTGGATLQVNGTLTANTPITVAGGTLDISGSLTLSVPLLLNSATMSIGGALTSSVPMTVNGGTLQVDTLKLPDLTLTNGAVLTSHSSTETNTHKLEIAVAGTVAVSSNSAIDVTGKGYLAQRTTGNTTDGAATGNSGGSYGGFGGDRNGVANAVYGDYTDPDDWGSGGRVGAGGGLVRISAQRLELDGRLWANGAGGSLASSTISGGGSGGGVYLAVGELAGNGSIQANGGPAFFQSGSGWTGGAGGGGRIAIYAGDFSAFPTANATASGNGGSYPGGAGTVYWRDTDEALGVLIIDRAGGGAGPTPLGLPGQNLVTFNEPVMVRGGAQVKLEHTGMAIEFMQSLIITNNGSRVEVEDVTFSGMPPLELTSGTTLKVNGTLIASTPITVDGGTLDIPGSLTLSVPLMLNSATMNVGGALTSSVPMTVNGGTLQVDRLGLPELTLTNGAVLTCQASTETNMHKLEITVAGTLTVSSNSAIDVTGKGYLAQRTTGNTTNGASIGHSGGSYGGLGGGTPNPVYGDYSNPNDWGSGGRVGAGGGLVRITAQRLELDGRLWANGAGGNIGLSISGGGSGGGIFVAVDELAGNGTIQANGGPAYFRPGVAWTGGGGGGGRIAVFAADFTGFAQTNATASGNGGSYPGGAGTVYWRDTDEALGVLIIDRAGGGAGPTPLGLPGQNAVVFSEPVIVRGGAQVLPEHTGVGLEFAQTLTISNNNSRVELEDVTLNGTPPLELSSGGTLVINGTLITTDPITVNGGTLDNPGSLTLSVPMTISGGTLQVDTLSLPELTLTNGAVLTSQTSTETNTHKLEIMVAGLVTVSSNSAIDVTGKGYLAQRTTGNTTNNASTGNSGGSYGGLGGEVNGSPNPVYGDYTDPDDWGSGGRVGAGGGLVRLTAQRLELDGGLWANGTGGGIGSFTSGGGSGGGIRVAVDELAGNGSIQANGGPAVFRSGSGWTGGAGGGGRVAIYAGDFSAFPTANATASGNGGSYPGGAGTVYWRDTEEALGVLIIDRSGGGAGPTPLGLPGQAAVVFNEPVMVRGGASVVSEHAGMSIEFTDRLTLSNDTSRVDLEDAVLGDFALLDWSGGTIAGTLTVTSNALVQIGGSSILSLSGSLLNGGQLIFGQTSPGEVRIQNGGWIHNLAGGVVELQTDRALRGTGGTGEEYFLNEGVLLKNVGTNAFSIAVAATNAGTVEVQSGVLALTSNFVQTAGLTLLNGGDITTQEPYQLLGGTLAGTNTFAGNVTNKGTVSPGVSPGLLTIAGHYTQTTNGTLSIELAGTSPGTNYDRLVVTGTADLAGTLTVTLNTDFYPATNALFTFLTAAVRTNVFDTFNYPSNDVGMQVNYAPTNAQMEVINVRPVFPVFGNQNHNEETLFSFNAAATDDDQPPQTLTYALSDPPEGASINANNGLISWTPTEAQGPMVTNLTARVTDSGTPNLTVSRTFQITVNEVNVPPDLTVPAAQTLDEETLLAVNVSATDQDVPTNSLTFSLVSPPDGVSIDPDTGAITWTPSEAQGPGAHPIMVRVTDNNPDAVNAQQLSTTNSFTVNVNEVNRPPTLLPMADRTIGAGVVLSIVNGVLDPDIPGNVFAFGLVTAPSGAEIGASSGVFTWRPPVAQADTTNIVTVQVKDNGAPNLGTNRSFQVIVNPLGEVTLTAVEFANGQFGIRVEGDAGPDYTLETTTTFTNWTALATTNPAALPFLFVDEAGGDSTNRFYRARLGP